MGSPDAEILWEVASGLARAAAEVSRSGRPLPPLLFFTDPQRTPEPWETAGRLPAGSAVVFRHFGDPEAREAALRLREATRASQCLLLIGMDMALAEAVEADGVHLSERALGHASAVHKTHPGWRVTGAAHSRQAVAGARGLDAVVLSPVFPAGGASAAQPALGLDRFTRIVRRSPCPIYALGGVDASNARQLAGSGACRLAGVSAIQAAFGPA